MKHTSYHIESASSETELIREVQRYLDSGWRLQGGVSVTNTVRDGDTTGTWYAQAMILTIDDVKQS